MKNHRLCVRAEPTLGMRPASIYKLIYSRRLSSLAGLLLETRIEVKSTFINSDNDFRRIEIFL